MVCLRLYFSRASVAEYGSGAASLNGNFMPVIPLSCVIRSDRVRRFTCRVFFDPIMRLYAADRFRRPT